MSRLYEGALGWDEDPAGRCRPGMVELDAFLADEFGAVSLGCYNPRAKTGGNSPSLHRDGRAIDPGFAGRLAVRDDAFDFLVKYAEPLNIQMVLNYRSGTFGGRRWRLPYRDGDTEAGLGTWSASGHWLHVERTNAGADDARPIREILGLAPKESASDFVPVVDVSKWQGLIDWQKLASTGVEGAIVRAGNGREPGPDPRFEENVAGAVAAGLDVGSYYWIRPDADETPEEQARTWLDYVDGFDVRFLMVDVEWQDVELGPEATSSWLRRFLGALTEAGWSRPVLAYSNGYYWNEYVRDVELAGRLDFVLAAYPHGETTAPADPADWYSWATSGRSRPVLPVGATSWQGWQFTASLPGAVFGVASAGLDGNLVRRLSWELWTADVDAPTPVPTPIPIPVPPPIPAPKPEPADPEVYVVNVTLPKLSKTTTRTDKSKKHVAGLQGILKAKSGAPAVVDGIFGDKTDDAVRAWQKYHGLTVDGVVGPKTWTSILEGPQ